MEKTVSIHGANPGDVLADDVITATGSIAMPLGMTLTREMLDHFKQLGVYTLIIRK